MKYQQLIESGSTNVNAMVMDLIMSLKASGIDQVPLSSISKEIYKRYNIDVDMNELSNILEAMPMVSSVDGGNITIGSKSNDSEESADEKVEKMAMNADYSDVTSVK